VLRRVWWGTKILNDFFFFSFFFYLESHRAGFWPFGLLSARFVALGITGGPVTLHGAQFLIPVIPGPEALFDSGDRLHSGFTTHHCMGLYVGSGDDDVGWRNNIPQSIGTGHLNFFTAHGTSRRAAVFHPHTPTQSHAFSKRVQRARVKKKKKLFSGTVMGAGVSQLSLSGLSLLFPG